MAYTTASGVTTDPNVTGDVVKVQDYDGAFTGLPQTRLDVLLRRAERRVKEVAPPPSPVAGAYLAAARDAELVAFEFLFRRPDYVESHSVTGESITYSRGDVLTRTIAEAMGDYALEEFRPDTASNGYAGFIW